ncbi:hypothetical protein VNI00_003015 [Paramarasmius palmivorus]|uniref:F-box domain-containing protein n=1 Tax=Paramarasmius palmivorus TaxID=297713 RepID=A0AAW0DXF0_9AGAR
MLQYETSVEKLVASHELPFLVGTIDGGELASTIESVRDWQTQTPGSGNIRQPVPNLPFDVLQEVFLACVEPQIASDIISLIPKTFNDSLDPTLPPWTLSQVCRSWRQAALMTSSLWTFIGIQMPTPDNTSVHKKNSMATQLSTLYSRSRNRPLSIEVKSYYPVSPDDVLLSTLCSHSSRWERVRFSFNGDDVLQSMSPLIKSKLPILHSLSVNLYGNIALNSALDAFEDAPKLQRVTVSGLPHDLYASLRIPWSQITRFTRHDTLSRTNMNISNHLAHMRDIVEYDDAGFQWPAGPNVHLPRLRKLILGLAGRASESIAWNRLQLSSRFDDMRVSGVTSNPGSFLPFLLRWGGTLRTLYLEDSLINEPDGVQVIGQLHSLQTLSLFYRRTTPDRLVKALTELHPLHFLPKLQHLSFFGAFNVAENAMVEMLLARLRGDNPLQTFGSPSYPSVEAAKELVRRGLVLRRTSHMDWSQSFSGFRLLG